MEAKSAYIVNYVNITIFGHYCSQKQETLALFLVSFQANRECADSDPPCGVS